MPVVLPLPTEVTVPLNLPVTEDPDQEAYVKVRPATTAEQIMISEFAAKRESQTINGTAITYKSDFSLAAIRRLQVYTTLAGCNLMERDPKFPDDVDKLKPIFDFKRSEGKMRFDGTEEEFNRIWGKLPSHWTDAIIDAVMSANPQWNPNAGE